MLLPGFCWKRTRIFSPIWMWVTTAVVLTRAIVDACEVLHPHSHVCHKPSNTTLKCDIKDNTVQYWLDNFRWETVRKVTIWNATRLVLKNPLCDSHIRTVEVRDSSSVTTEPGDDNCAQRLHLQDCTGVTIEDGINHVVMDSSEAGKISLQGLHKLDIKDSLVKELFVDVVNDKATVTNSTIEVVMKMLINGSVTLSIDDSTLEQVEGFIYDSNRDAVLKELRVDSVASKGFLVHNGELTLDNCIIGSVAPMGLLVVNGAKLTLQNCVIEDIVHDSIMVTDGGNIYLENVTVGQERDIFLTFLGASVPLYPLAFLTESSISSYVWIIIAVFIGLIVGALVGVGVMMIVMRRRQTMSTEGDSMELKTQKQSTGQTAYSHMGQTSSPPSDSTGTKPQVDNAPLPPPIQRTQRFPGPMPPETNIKEMGERANLPLPPPPPPPADEDEELYDEVQDASRQRRNLGAFTPHMPKLPHMKKRF